MNDTYSNDFRAKRLRTFMKLADAALARRGTCRILDIGGEVAYWNGLKDVWKDRPLDITMVNIHVDPHAVPDGFKHVQGDARHLPDYPDNSFDIVHSNSVIEHVGMWPDMKAMAGEVRRLAPAYFIQTPNFWFPQEPHLRVPFIHWLPRPWRRQIVMARACGFYPRAKTVDEAYKILADAILLDMFAMRSLFPDARIAREQFGPLTKSLIAIKDEVA